MSKSKRIIALSDLHCGSVVGLTPPGYRRKMVDGNPKWGKHSQLSKELWDFFASEVRAVRREKPIDIMFCLGDCIDGTGRRSGGTELITTDRELQAYIAAECLNYVQAKKKVIVYGTPYHTGESEDYENLVAERTDADIGSHRWVDVNGVVFDLKHFVGGSTIPHGRTTAMGREQLWNLIYSEYDEQPKADVILRGHCHYHEGRFNPLYMGMILPALQGYGSKYGARQCSGKVDFGFVVFDINEKGEYSWRSHIAKIQAHKRKAIKL